MSTIAANFGGEAVIALTSGESGIPLLLVDPGMEAVGLVRHLGPGRPVFGVRVPNLERAATPHRIERIAAACAGSIRERCPDGPYALAGWCAAGFLALEIARQLEQGGAEVALVAMFDARTVHLPPVPKGKLLAVRCCHFFQRVEFFVSRTVAQGRSPLQAAVSSRLNHARAAHFRAMRGLPPSLDDTFVAAIRNYQPAPWPGRIVHIWAAERPRGLFRDPQFICGFLSPQGFGFYEVPGNHISMLAEPRIAEVSRILAWEIDRVSGIQGLGPGARSTISSRKIS